MSDLAEIVARDLAAYYEMVGQQVHHWVDPLSSQQVWRRPYPYGNTIGHLLLHLTGNLSYYIGTRVQGSGYVRDRDREFLEKEHRPKEELLAAFDHTIQMVVQTIREQRPEDWAREYSAEREPEATERFHIFLRSAGHAYHHVGQIIYISREIARQDQARVADSSDGWAPGGKA